MEFTLRSNEHISYIKGNNVIIHIDEELENLKNTTENNLATKEENGVKADKVTNATEGNFAGLDSEGNLTDSGKKASDFANSTHTHTKNQITDFPTLGTAAAKDVPSSGNASSSQVVLGNDSRLSDSRNAADVSAWAKAANKPSYNLDEVADGTNRKIPTKVSDLTNDSNFTSNTGTVTGVKVGTDSYSPSSGVVSLPAYPTSLPADGGNAATVNNHSVNADVPADADFTNTWRPLGTGANDACAGNDSRLSDSRDPKSHTHGNIKNTGALQDSDVAVANGDKLVIADLSDSGKVARSGVQFDGSTTNKALTPKGTFETFLQSHQSKSDIGLGNVTNDAQVKRSEMGVASGVATLGSDGKVPSSQLPAFVDDVIEGYLSETHFYKEAAHTNIVTDATGASADQLSNKVYIDLATSKSYRWTGSAYGVIGSDLALGETSSTAYYGDKGKTAYDHSQSTHARTDATKTEGSSTNGNIKINGTETTVYTHPTTTAATAAAKKVGKDSQGHVVLGDALTKSDVGLGNVENTGDSATPVSGGTTKFTTGGAYTELNKKVDKTVGVTGVSYDTTNKKIQKTINGSTTDVVTAAKIVEDGGGIKSHQAVTDNNPTLSWGTKSKVATIGSTDINVTMPSNPNTDTKVTSVDNHYSPSVDANSELTASLDGTEGVYAKDTEYSVVTGVKIQRDAKGHVTGVKTTKLKIKDTNNTYTVNNATYSIKSKIGNDVTTISDFTANLSTADDFTLIQGDNITFTNDTTNRTIKISGTPDTKVTLAANHYTPERVTTADKSASATGATAAWSIDVVTGVTLQTDGKGHVTGITVSSGKIPGNPNTWRGILNNLTSDSTTDSLSAAQGKVLNEKFASYLPLIGGTMTGTLSFKDSNALPEENNMLYFLGINAFVNGGTMRWISKENAKVGYATTAGSAPASDVYAWAKASTKPSYSYSEITSRPTHWANIGLQTSANYITEPEIKSVKINGSSTNAASTENCQIQYDTTNKCLKFLFN